MKASDFLLHAAECIDLGKRIGIPGADDWARYVAMTFPPLDEWNEYDIAQTRVLRFCLAAAIARSEGN